MTTMLDNVLEFGRAETGRLEFAPRVLDLHRLCEEIVAELEQSLQVDGGMRMSAALYRHGIWAMFAGFDRAVLQFKPGLFVDEAYCNEALTRFEAALQVAKTRTSAPGPAA
jgi:signal transduction histidine kinase